MLCGRNNGSDSIRPDCDRKDPCRGQSDFDERRYIRDRRKDGFGNLHTADRQADPPGHQWRRDHLEELETVYNFQVEDFHTYYVGNCGVLVHNADYSTKLIPNKKEGLRREQEAQADLKKRYPESEGYRVESEKLLRDSKGKKALDPKTGKGRRIDFVVGKDGNIVDSIEATSTSADKSMQIAKESRIRQNGGNYIRLNDGRLVEIPQNIITRLERRN